ncbi:RNA-binding S4 domain-containing protein [Rhodobacter sp. ETT8]|uniref:RNA-binding S4 domain-containing protein n=1 Tax=Pseudotabrizicola algicola TaxID=2709381 RepID=A0A6B3RWH0_9RHOB|nr:RNA-binding S4 domain-containing protein [Pseudotabrizicola algicola]NEX47369.1 RNA-binding S4 domain-containing protein [Pseudotabrizicola algicola]
MRLDKWLWQARFFKSRSLCAEVIEGGHCRVNGQRTLKPGYSVGVGDVLTFAQGKQIRVIKVQALGLRRGPATEAQQLYLDLDPNATPEALE